MSYYCTFGELQDELKNYYRKTGEKLQFNEAIERLYNSGRLQTERPEPDHTYTSGHESIDEFEKITDGFYFPVVPQHEMYKKVSEEDIIPQLSDAFVIRHPRYTRPYMHRHNYVEIDYVVRGSCNMYFEEETHTFGEGTMMIIAPGSTHDIEIPDESIVYCLMLRRSTFQTTFFTLLSRDDVLSSFFRKVLLDGDAPNYLIMHAQEQHFIQVMLQSAMKECHEPDLYSNSCCISLIYLMFGNLLRGGIGEPEFYHYQMTSDFSSVLSYIRRNYRTITLTDLAEEFHYSKPHMCTLIKQNTGTNFSALIRQVRLTEAKEYLIKTDISISDIAEIVGYNSADNFSRVFRKVYGVSPLEYRRQNTVDDSHFVPFSHS